jgi:molecular chaperone DnaJ
MAKNYYAILGLACAATVEDIKSAYRRLAKEFHPDRYRGGGRPFLEVQEAYSVLGDADRRARYDQSLAVRPARPYAGLGKPVSPSEPEPLIPAARPADFGDISPVRSFETFTPSFDEIFDWLWSNFRGLSQPKSERLQSLTVEVPVTPEEAHRGGQARILVPAQARCPTCRGYGGVGPCECTRCAGRGVLVGELPVHIAFPPGLAADHTVLVSLDRFRIHNMYLTVAFRLTSAAGP